MAALYSYQVVVNDTSPLWQYYGSWTQCSALSGCATLGSAGLPSGATYHAVDAASIGASVMLPDYGGDTIQLYGQYSNATGLNLQLDNTLLLPLPSYSDGLDSLILDATVNASAWIPDEGGPHSLDVTLQGTMFNLTSAVISGTSPQPVTNVSLGYWVPSVHMSGTWTTVAAEGLSNGTALTNDPAATASLDFTGIGFVIYSSINSTYSRWNLTLDGSTQMFYISTQQAPALDTVIYYAMNLTSGPHTLVMSNWPGTPGVDETGADAGTSAGTVMGLNSITVVQLSDSAGGSGSTTSSAPSSTPTSSATTSAAGGNATNVGATVGGVIGGVIGLALLALAAWFLMRKRQRSSTPGPFVPLNELHQDKQVAAVNKRASLSSMPASFNAEDTRMQSTTFLPAPLPMAVLAPASTPRSANNSTAVNEAV